MDTQELSAHERYCLAVAAQAMFRIRTLHGTTTQPPLSSGSSATPEFAQFQPDIHGALDTEYNSRQAFNTGFQISPGQQSVACPNLVPALSSSPNHEFLTNQEVTESVDLFPPQFSVAEFSTLDWQGQTLANGVAANSSFLASDWPVTENMEPLTGVLLNRAAGQNPERCEITNSELNNFWPYAPRTDLTSPINANSTPSGALTIMQKPCSASISQPPQLYDAYGVGMNNLLIEPCQINLTLNGMSPIASNSSPIGYNAQLEPQSEFLSQFLLPNAVCERLVNERLAEPENFEIGINESALPRPSSANLQLFQYSTSSDVIGTREKRYHANNAQTPSRPSKKRRFPNHIQNEHANRVRSLRACVRCSLQGNMCKINPKDPGGICLTCQELNTTMDKLPCFRFKITDAVLSRKDVDSDFGRPNFDINFNFLKPVRAWDTREIRTIVLTAGFDETMSLQVHKASVLNQGDISEHERFIYERPWALLDFNAALNEVGRFLRSSIKTTVAKKINKEHDALAHEIFERARSMACGKNIQEPSSLLKDVLMIWTGSRHIEGGWRFHGSETLGQRSNNEHIVSLTEAPIIDSQVSSIIVIQYLLAAQESALKMMKKFTDKSKSRKTRWFEMFLAYFILLHNCECVMKHQRKWANQTNPQFRYTPKMMKLVKGILCTVDAFLYYWRYSLKGQFPFNLDWRSKRGAKFAELSDDQLSFVQWVSSQVEGKTAYFNNLFQSKEWETDYSFTGQLFVQGPGWILMPAMEDPPLAPPMGPPRP